MVSRIQDRLILIPFGNGVYHLPKSLSFNLKNVPRKPETNIQKRFEDMKSEFPSRSFQRGNSRIPFQKHSYIQLVNFVTELLPQKVNQKK